MFRQRVTWRHLIFLGALGFGVLLSPVAPELHLELGLRGAVVRDFPAPYRMGLVPGETALSLAMVHDVIHERYPVHGKAYHEHRKAKALKIVEQVAEDAQSLSPKQRDAFDVLAVSYDKLHEPMKAVAVMRRKLAIERRFNKALVKFEEEGWSRKQVRTKYRMFKDSAYYESFELGEDEEALYRSYANLGTFLAHSSIKGVMAGDEAALRRLQEARRCIELAIALKPYAHFGREVWQLTAIDHFLAVAKEPQLLLRFDMCGGLLTSERDRGTFVGGGGLGTYMREFRRNPAFERFRQTGVFESKEVLGWRNSIREAITPVGMSPEWREKVDPLDEGPVPFDEPTLGFLGMWMLGGGPNPHSSLALANIMDQVGQKFIAWCAYERCVRLAERFWSDKSICDQIRDHCRAQQASLIERMLSEDEVSEEALRAQFEEELALGLKYQRDYQDYEAKALAAGKSLGSEDFYEGFFNGRESIATSPGEADTITFRDPILWVTLVNALPLILLCAGFGAFVGFSLGKK